MTDARILATLLTLALVGCDDAADATDAAPTDAAVLVDAETDSAVAIIDAAMLDVGLLDAEVPELDAEAPEDDAGPMLPPGEIVVVDGPEDAPERFADLPEGDCVDPPVVIYPEQGTALPRNIEGIDLQWDPGRFAGDPSFEIEMITDDARVRWYTAADNLIPGGDPWTRVKEAAARAPGGRLEVYVREYRGPDQPACEAALELEISTSQLKGAVYYFDTGMGGIARLPVNDAQAERFLTPDLYPGAFCYGCHAVSRDGTRMAYTRSFGFPAGNLEAVAIDQPGIPFYMARQDTVALFPSFAPDNLRVVATTGGRLVITSVDTGDQLDQLPSHPEQPAAGAPDWSWQGDNIVGVVGGFAVPVAERVPLGSIARWDFGLDGTWQPPTIIVPQGPRSWDRPAYSPDGAWVAFNGEGDDPVQGGAGDNNRVNPNLDLWVVDPDGGDPIRLDRANMGEFMGNSWPKWAPVQGAGRIWLAFTSLRPYGRVVPNDPLSQAAEPLPQIWVTGIDPLAEPGSDPSAPAFWMPGQNTQGGNHAPYWAPYEKE